MTAAVNVRAIVPADLDEWVRVRAMLWPAPADAHLEEVRGYFERGDIGGVPHGVFFAVAGARVIGFAEASLRESAHGCLTSPVGFLEGWFIERGSRRAGAGRALVRACEDWCRGRVCAEMGSDTAAEWARESVPAHLACGFEIVAVLERDPEGESAGPVTLFRKGLC